MNSQLYFESAPGFGSNIHFCVAFPRTTIAASRGVFSENTKTPSRRLTSKNPQARTQSLCALVVEDHPASRQIISLQLEALGIHVSVCDNANTALTMVNERHFDLLITDQSIPGMQGSELAQKIRALGFSDLIIIGVTADIYALDSRHQYLVAGMNGVLIKPLSLMSLENELTRYFDTEEVGDQINSEGLYSFDAFSVLLKDDPKQTLVILDEIKKVHNEVLDAISTKPIDFTTISSLIHKIKGGAQLLNAKQFIQSCESIEKEPDFHTKITSFKRLLEEQNLIIERYRAKQSTS
jgi:two-component system sensor histidine kinase EvgS